MAEGHTRTSTPIYGMSGEKGAGGEKKKNREKQKSVGARQLSYAPHNAARQNPTHYSFTHNMMPLVCRPLQQCTDAGVTAHFGQPHARAFRTVALNQRRRRATC